VVEFLMLCGANHREYAVQTEPHVQCGWTGAYGALPFEYGDE
jgi:hypothetical protein